MTGRVLLRTNQFDYKLLESIYEKKALTLVTESFVSNEPLTIYKNYSKEVTEQSFLDILNGYKGRELSVVCIERSTDEVCGAYFCNQINASISELSDSVSSELEDLYALLDSMIEELARRNIDVTQGCNQAVLGVGKNWAGRQIGKNLVLASIEIAKEHRIPFVFSELTSPVSQNIYEKLGFSFIHEVQYKDLLYKNQKVFENLSGCCKLALKHIL